MPTIIDSLIVELGLDPSKFSEGQRKASDELRKMEQQAGQTGKRVEGSGDHIRSFFSTIENPAAAVRKHLVDLATQSRRTGSSVEAGSMVGARGLAMLGVAGLAALAALKTVRGTLDGVLKTSGEAAGAGRLAGVTGIPTRAMSAVGLAARETVNADPNVVAQDLANYAWRLSRFKQFGEYAEEFTWLQSRGITAENPIEALRQTSGAMRSMSGPDQATLAEKTGWSYDTMQFMRLSEAQREAAIARANELAITEKQAGTLDRLTNAINRSEDAAAAFARELTTNFAPVLEGLAKSIAWVFGHGPGEWLWKHTIGYDEHPGPNAPPDNRGWWSRVADAWGLPEWAGAKPAPKGPGPRQGVAGSASMPANAGEHETYIRSIIRQAGGNEMAQAGLLSNFHAESRGLDPTAVNPTSGATGWAQWLGPRLRRLRELGDPLARETQGKLLLEELTGQYRQVLERMNRAGSPEEAAEIGLKGFEGVNEANSEIAGAPWPAMLRTHVARAQEFFRNNSAAASTPSPASSSAQILASETDLRRKYDASVARFNETERKAGDHYATSHPETFEQWKARNTDAGVAPAPTSGPLPGGRYHASIPAAVATAQGAVAGRGTVNNTTHDTDTNINQIVVNAPMREGGAIVDAIRRATDTNMLVTQSNTGLD